MLFPVLEGTGVGVFPVGGGMPPFPEEPL